MFFVYILTNKKNGTLYTGVTKDLVRRVWEHKNSFIKDSFTSRYKLNKLVYYEQTSDITTAIEREKQIKAGSREKKIALINKFNEEWKDLYQEITK